jgi:hypothetical protein
MKRLEDNEVEEKAMTFTRHISPNITNSIHQNLKENIPLS